MVSLDLLPAELLRQIAEDLEPEDLECVSLSCKRLYSATLSRRWNAVRLDCSHFADAARLLLTRPHLAPLVKILHIEESYKHGIHDDRDNADSGADAAHDHCGDFDGKHDLMTNEFEFEHDEAASERLASLTQSMKEWLQPAKFGLVDRLQSHETSLFSAGEQWLLVLALLPGLDSLIINCRYLFHHAHAYTKSLELLLPSLSNLDFNVKSGVANSARVEEVVFYMKHPALKTLTMSEYLIEASPQEVHAAALGCAMPTLSITKFALTGATNNHRALEHLFMLTKDTLQEFEWTWTTTPTIGLDVDFNWSQTWKDFGILTGLRTIKLKSGLYRGDRTPITSFDLSHACACLTSISLDPIYLTEVLEESTVTNLSREQKIDCLGRKIGSILPASVVTLALNPHRYHMQHADITLEAANRIADACHMGYLPNLRVVLFPAVWIQWYSDEYDEAVFVLLGSRPDMDGLMPERKEFTTMSHRYQTIQPKLEIWAGESAYPNSPIDVVADTDPFGHNDTQFRAFWARGSWRHS